MLKKAKSDDSADLWQTLRDVCARLSLGLREHIGREEQLLVTRNHSLGTSSSEVTVRPLIDHYGDYRYLQVMTRSITFGKNPFLLNSRYQLLSNFLHELHRHMNLQEAELFPAIEQVMTSSPQPIGISLIDN